MDEIFACDKFIYAQLSGDDALTALVEDRIFRSRAPRSDAGNPASVPYVIFEFTSGRDTSPMGRGAPRIASQPEYLVKAVTSEESSFSVAAEIADAIDEVMQIAEGTVEYGGKAFVVRSQGRSSPVSYPEDSDGIEYQHQGGLYTLWINEE
jgi:hypothetical protein